MKRKVCYALGFAFAWFAFGFTGSNIYAASASLADAKKQAETKGFIFEANHADIVAKAKQQGGKIRALSSLDPGLFPHMTSGFKKNYPFLDATMVEVTGTDANERFFLELKAGTVKDFDVVQLAPERYPEYLPYAKKFDILGMAEQRVLNIEPKMVDPKNRNVVSLATVLFVAVYNKNLLSADKVPTTWDGFLRPDFKGRKMMVDIRPIMFSTFAACPDQGMGVEWMVNYAQKIRAQEPIWVRGFSRTLAAMNAEYPPLLRGAGIGGTVIVFVFVNELGKLEEVRLQKSSGHRALDEAALTVAEQFDFSPALNRDEPVPVWVQFPITFQPAADESDASR